MDPNPAPDKPTYEGFDRHRAPSDTNRIPIEVYKSGGFFTGDYTYHRILSCSSHPHLRWSSKDPYARSIFFLGDAVSITGSPSATECNCHRDDMTVVGDQKHPDHTTYPPKKA